MPPDPPSSHGWPPDKVVDAVSRLTDQQRESDRRQTLINIGLLVIAVAAFVVAIISLFVN